MRIPTATDRVKYSLAVNIAYAVYNWFLGIYFASWWFITLGAYYTLLGVMRFAVLRIKNYGSTERFARRVIGILFLVMSVCLFGVVVLTVVTDKGEKFHEIVMISIALYAFTKVSLAVMGIVRAKRAESSAISMLRNITLADATVSIFSLQRSMLQTFEGMGEGEIKLFNMLTGGGVCLLVFMLGINLIGGKGINMAKSKIVKANQRIADAVVSGYKKIENGVVGGYQKIEDKFVDTYLTREGETVEEAKKRLKEQK